MKVTGKNHNAIRLLKFHAVAVPEILNGQA